MTTPEHPTPDSWEAGLTVGEDIAALAEAVTTCIEALTVADTRHLQPALVQALHNQENVLADISRRYARNR